MALRVIVVGMGSRGGQWAGEIQRSPNWRLVAVVDTDHERRSHAMTALGLSEREVFTTVGDALDACLVDAVVIATPPAAHGSCCEEALARGLGVLVEKPFALDVATASGLAQLAQRQGAPLVVGQTYRYLRSQRTVRRLVEQGALGEVGLVECRFYRTSSGIQPWVRHMPHGVLWEIGVHHLDALRHTLGREPVAVLADAREGDGDRGGTVQMLLRFEGGVRGHYAATYDSVGHEWFEKGHEFYERVVGERATLHVLQRWLVLCERGRLPRPIRRGPRTMTEEAILLGQLERALRSGEEPEASAVDNLGTVALLEAAQRSAEEGRWINPMELIAAHG